MNFLTAAKELKEAQALLATKDTELAALNEQLSALKTENEAAAKLLTETTGKLEAVESQLKAANESVAKLEADAKETAAKIEQAATAKSIAQVASLGHETVKAIVNAPAPKIDPKLTGLERAIAAHKESKTKLN